MDMMQALVLALIQGLTEFLPISSSGHLILPSVLLGWDDQGLAFDVAVHFGTLLAVLLYFRRDIAAMATAWSVSLLRRQHSDDSRLAWWVILATLPAVVAGFLLEDWIEAHLRTASVLAASTLVFGIFLGVSQYFSHRARQCRDLTLWMVLIIGFAQALALIPRYFPLRYYHYRGSFLGLSLVEASRFSFLLSIPVIAGASLLKTVDLVTGSISLDLSLLVLAMSVSAITAFFCIGWFMHWVERIGLMPFAVYRVLLAGVIFIAAT